jgi:uncharacterized membrane protein
VTASLPGRPPARARSTGRSILAGVLIGIGVAGFLDETVFHQLLHWHHFYDRSTTSVGLVSDGFFHAGSWLCTVGGLFVFADLQRRASTVPRRLAAGAFLGWGGFQVYDGLVQHKVLRLHQIRYSVDVLAYDVVWNVLGALGIVIGLALLLGDARSVGERRSPAEP